MKKKQLPTFFITITCSGEGSILTAVCKNTTIEAAKEFSKKLWSIGNNPYRLRIMNEDIQEVFSYKK